MKYYEVKMNIVPCSQDAQDLLSALSAEAGFETFEETPTGLTGYVQQDLFDRSALDDAISSFPLAETHISYEVKEAEDRDWNEQWEQEGFEPIIISGQKAMTNSVETDNGTETDADTIIIHDGRHLVEPTAFPNGLFVEIDARQAFGTGTHETTRMMCATLLSQKLKGKKVLDCGCGTGILGITALKLGADSCTAYDIDEWSTDNTRHNAIINQTDNRLTVLLGDASVLQDMQECFDIVMANINRNILLHDMERFAQVLKKNGVLMLSGFYDNDCAMLTDKAQSLGLTLIATRNEGDWAALEFKKG